VRFICFEISVTGVLAFECLRMGHRLAGMTFARYGRAGSRKLLPGALARLKYPKPL
jgi:hypothetical protein